MPAQKHAVVRHIRVPAKIVHPAGERDGIVGMARSRHYLRKMVHGLPGFGIELSAGHGGDEFMAAGIPRARRHGRKGNDQPQGGARQEQELRRDGAADCIHARDYPVRGRGQTQSQRSLG
jgi:hypothetical protein